MRTRTRSSRERGAALLVALVLVMLVVAMVEALLVIPGLELERARTTTAKEKALATADAGVRAAIVWIGTNAPRLGALLPQPTPGSAPTAVYVSGYWSSPSNGIVSYSGSLPLATPTFAWAPPGGPYGSPCNGIRYGDPLMAHGEFAYRVAPLGGDYYQIDAEGHALGTTARGSAPTKFVAKVRAVVFRKVDNEKLAGLGAFLLGGDSASQVGGGNATLTTTSNQSNKIGVNGLDASGVTSGVPGIVVPTGTGYAYSSPSPYAQTIKGVPALEGGTSTSPLQPDYSGIDALVQKARLLPPMDPGTGDYTSTTYQGQPVNLGTDNSLGGTVPSVGLTYVSIPAGTTVTGPVATTTSTPGASGGIFIIDVESTPAAPVTLDMGSFGGVPAGLVDFPGSHDYRGTVILYVHGGGPVRLVDPAGSGLTNALVLADKSGNGSNEVAGGLLHYDSTKVLQSVRQLPAPTYFAAYTVIQ